MFLVSALLALSAAQAAPATIDEKEKLCVFDGLDDATLAKLAELGSDPDADAGGEVVRVAAPAVEKCAVTWKWGKRGRVVGALTAAAYAGLMVQEHALEGRLDGKRLRVLFDKMSEEDRHALTFDGSQTPPADLGKALNARFAAMLAGEGVPQADFQPVAYYFTAGARFGEMEAIWQQFARTGTR
jgi:hypothetical protein